MAADTGFFFSHIGLPCSDFPASMLGSGYFGLGQFFGDSEDVAYKDRHFLHEK